MIFKKIGFKFAIIALFLFNISFAEIIKTNDFEIKGENTTISFTEFNTIVDILRNWFFDNVTGYMGLGTDTPDAKLDVAGQIKISGGFPGIGKVLTSDATGLATWEDTAISSQWNNISDGINYAGDNVGIGTTNPRAKLEVNGIIKIGDITVSEAKKGMIRYHSALDDFCGYDGTEWISLTGKSSCIVCTVSSWSPAISTVCSGTIFTQTSNCSTTRSATGTKTTDSCCTVSSWSPATSTVCSGTIFTQTSNCSTTRSATGTKTTDSCCTVSSWSPATSTVCSGTTFTQTSNCSTTQSATGTKTTGSCCTVSSWSPATNTVCSGTTFTQTSNCSTTRSATGTKDCCTPGLCSVCPGPTMPADDSSCGTIDCDGKNYYYTSGTASATGTNYCKYRNYADLTSSRCEGLGDCKDANTTDCTSYANSTAATCGTCKYATGACNSCSNYASGTSCGTNKECNGSGSCVNKPCVAGNYYNWSGSCSNFCASIGGTTTGVGVLYFYKPNTIPCGNSHTATYWPSWSFAFTECQVHDYTDEFGDYMYSDLVTMCRCSCP